MEKITNTPDLIKPHTKAKKPKKPLFLQFYGNHSLDFENNDIEALEYYAISKLRKIPLPDKVLLTVYDSLIKQFHHGDISKFVEIENWVPVKFPSWSIVNKIPKQHIVTFGPMGMHLVITPHHIKLPAVLDEHADWQSPQNKETIQILRSYYRSIINLFGGDHALYVEERIADKYYDDNHEINGSPLLAFEQTLKDHYGINNKPLSSIKPGKYPKYYIDTFTALGGMEHSTEPHCGEGSPLDAAV